jgi:hypothetical protein
MFDGAFCLINVMDNWHILYAQIAAKSERNPGTEV